MMNLFLVAWLGVGAHQIAVIEAPAAGEPRDPDLGLQLATRLQAAAPAEVAARVAERLPPIAAGVKSETVLEAGRMVDKGRDAYLDGKFVEATRDLGQARELLARAIESFEEERQAADTLFRAHLYLAFTLRAKGGDAMPQAVEAMREAIRTFPTLEPSFSEYGPENVKFFREVKAQMDRGPTGRLRVTTPGEQASVYLNGRLVGVTPLDLKRVYAGRYRMHLRQGGQTSRLRVIDIDEGERELEVDLAFDRALRADETAQLVYPAAEVRRAQIGRHGADLARVASVEKVLAYWQADGVVHLALVDRQGNVRHATANKPDVMATAAALRDGRTGEVLPAELPRGKRVWTWVAGGVAVAALATGIAFGLSSQSDLDDLNKRCPGGGCMNPADLQVRDDAQSKALVADVMYGVAGAAVVGSALLFYYEGRPLHSERASLTPVVGPRFAGAEIELRF